MTDEKLNLSTFFASEDKLSEVNRILGMAGTTFFFSWLSVLYLSPNSMTPSTLGFEQTMLLRTCGLAGFLIGFFIINLVGKKVFAPILRFGIFATIALYILISCLPLLLFTFDYSTMMILSITGWALTGIAGSAMVMEIGIFYTHLYEFRGNYIALYTVSGITTTAILFWLSTTFAFLDLVSLVMLPLVAQAMLSVFPVWIVEPKVEPSPSDLKEPEFRRVIWGLMFYCLISGFVTFIGFKLSNPTLGNLWITALFIFLGGAIFGLIPLIFKGIATLSLTRWFLLPLPVVALLVLPLLDSFGKIMLCGIWLAGFVCYGTTSLTTIVAIAVNSQKMNIVRLLCTGSTFSVLGTGAGWGLGLSIDNLAGLTDTTLTIASVSLVILFVTGFTFFMRPTPEAHHAANKKSNKGMWRRKYDELSDKYKLTPREREVFLWLSRGRNAEYIRNALYISDHTAKTHIYHIYRKMGIHTQQELLAFYEELIPKEDKAL
jgi:DNA-binding CsgD family transcriptional regulator